MIRVVFKFKLGFDYDQFIFNFRMKILIFALAASILGNGVAAVPVNITSMIDYGTINVDGVGPIHIVTPWGGNVEVNILCLIFFPNELSSKVVFPNMTYP